MAQNRGGYIFVDGHVVHNSKCSFRILHDGREVATLSTEPEVWHWYFAKRDEVQAEKRELGQEWNDLAIGVHGLVMINWGDHLNRLEWKTRICRASA